MEKNFKKIILFVSLLPLFYHCGSDGEARVDSEFDLTVVQHSSPYVSQIASITNFEIKWKSSQNGQYSVILNNGCGANALESGSFASGEVKVLQVSVGQFSLGQNLLRICAVASDGRSGEIQINIVRLESAPQILISSVSHYYLSSYAKTNTLVRWQSTQPGPYEIRLADDCVSGSVLTTGSIEFSKLSENVETQVAVSSLVAGENNLTICQTSAINLLGYNLLKINRDDFPPVTTATPAGGSYAASQSVELICTNDCEKIVYTTDGSNPIISIQAFNYGEVMHGNLYTSPIITPLNQITQIRFRAIDKAGNVEATKIQYYTVDTSLPDISIFAVNHTVVSSASGFTSFTVSWQSNRDNLSFNFRIASTSCNNGNIITGVNASGNTINGVLATTINASQLIAGSNTIRICVENLVGNFGEATLVINREDEAAIITQNNISQTTIGQTGTQQAAWHWQSNQNGEYEIRINGNCPSGGIGSSGENGGGISQVASNIISQIRFNDLNIGANTAKVCFVGENGRSAELNLDIQRIDALPILSLNGNHELYIGANGQTQATLSWQSNVAGSYQLKSGVSCKLGTNLAIAGASGNAVAGTPVNINLTTANFAAGTHHIWVCQNAANGAVAGIEAVLINFAVMPQIRMVAEPGTYTSSVPVKLYCDPTCVKIAYTIDETEPSFDSSGSIINGTLFSGAAYNTPDDNGAVTVKARAYYNANFQIQNDQVYITDSDYAEDYAGVIDINRFYLSNVSGNTTVSLTWSYLTSFSHYQITPDHNCYFFNCETGVPVNSGTMNRTINLSNFSPSLPNGLLNIILKFGNIINFNYQPVVFYNFPIIIDYTAPVIHGIYPQNGSSGYAGNLERALFIANEDLQPGNIDILVNIKNSAGFAPSTLLTRTSSYNVLRREMEYSDIVLPQNAGIIFNFANARDKASNVTSNGIFQIVTSANRAQFKISDSGQNSCYDSAGIVISCVTTGAGQDGTYIDVPAKRQFISNGAGVVTDLATGLVWKKCAYGQGNGDSCNSSPTGVSWEASLGSCQALNSINDSSTNFLINWRLPTVNELATLVNYGNTNPAGDSVFQNQPPGYFWTLDARKNATNNSDAAWAVSFASGQIRSQPKNNSYYVRCVSNSLNNQNSLQYANRGDGTVSELATKLRWEQFPDSVTTITWQAAINYCTGLNVAGKGDPNWVNRKKWRLPSIKELKTLTNSYYESTAIETAYFPSAQANYYWSSSSLNSAPQYAWAVSMVDGGSSFKQKNESNYVRCVANEK